MREIRPSSAILPLSLLLLWTWTSVAYAQTNGYRVFWPNGAGPHPAIAFLSGCSGFAPVGARKFCERVAETLPQEGYVGLFVEYVGRRGLQSCASPPMVSEGDAAKDLLTALS